MMEGLLNKISAIGRGSNTGCEKSVQESVKDLNIFVTEPNKVPEVTSQVAWQAINIWWDKMEGSIYVDIWYGPFYEILLLKGQ